MPLVKVEMRKGKSREYKKVLLDIIHQALINSLKIEEWDRFQRIYELESEDYDISSIKSEDFMIITFDLFPERSVEKKRS